MDQYEWRSPFSSATFHPFQGNSDVFSKVSNFLQHGKLCSKWEHFASFSLNYIQFIGKKSRVFLSTDFAVEILFLISHVHLHYLA